MKLFYYFGAKNFLRRKGFREVSYSDATSPNIFLGDFPEVLSGAILNNLEISVDL